MLVRGTSSTNSKQHQQAQQAQQPQRPRRKHPSTKACLLRACLSLVRSLSDKLSTPICLSDGSEKLRGWIITGHGTLSAGLLPLPALPLTHRPSVEPPLHRCIAPLPSSKLHAPKDGRWTGMATHHPLATEAGKVRKKASSYLHPDATSRDEGVDPTHRQGLPWAWTVVGLFAYPFRHSQVRAFAPGYGP